jgi:hypothetical protein
MVLRIRLLRNGKKDAIMFEASLSWLKNESMGMRIQRSPDGLKI